ncbi:MAG: PriCT-2 domain-containing protein [Lentisphaeria bacterium]|nr:PriCT-2 domain-containing protein [Lentisphaeria bacterium]
MTENSRIAAELLALISKSRADVTSDWSAVCIALKNCQVPYQLFENWSLTSRYQDKYQIKRAWNNLKGNYSIATLYFFARLDHGYIPEHLRKFLPKGISVGTSSSPVFPVRSAPAFDGDKVFDTLIQPYRECSLSTLEHELITRSPYQLGGKSGVRDFCALLDSLYFPDDLLYVGSPRANPAEQQRGIKSVREHLDKPYLSEYFRPNPLKGTPVTREDGKQSFVSDACVAGFRYAVLEFDERPLIQQYAFYLSMLDRGLPIAALTFSGNKSIHCLLTVNCADAAEWTDKVENTLFRNNLELLGCDGACKNESRSSRTPGALRRDNAVRQRLLYLDPETVKYTLCDKSTK